MTDAAACSPLKSRKSAVLFLVLLALAMGTAVPGSQAPKRPEAPVRPGGVRPGVEVFLEKYLDLVRGKRVGLITNPTGADSRLRSTVDLLARHPAVKLVALYGPEHGVRGDAQAGEYVRFYDDPVYHLPVFSLYGQSMKPEPGMLKNIDDYMRSFDTKSAGKAP